MSILSIKSFHNSTPAICCSFDCFDWQPFLGRDESERHQLAANMSMWKAIWNLLFITKKLNCWDVIGKSSRGLQISPVKKELQFQILGVCLCIMLDNGSIFERLQPDCWLCTIKMWIALGFGGWKRNFLLYWFLRSGRFNQSLRINSRQQNFESFQANIGSVKIIMSDRDIPKRFNNFRDDNENCGTLIKAAPAVSDPCKRHLKFIDWKSSHELVESRK